jgi:integrase
MRTSINANTTLAELVDFWLDHLRTEGRLEATTINEYERVLRKLVVPALGPFPLTEVSTSHIDAVLAELGTQSVNLRRKAKVVTGAMLDVAVDLAALPANPVRGSMSVRRPKTERRALTLDDLDRVRAAVRAWASKDRPGPKSSSDMADLIDLMLATGARIGEVLAIRWSDVDLDRGRVVINATIKTESGRGTYRKPHAGERTASLPEFAVDLLRRRTARRSTNVDAVFPTRNGTWQQVNNVERRWRQIRQEADLEWVTPHAFRGLLAQVEQS